jgi:asparagine synthase (glutamine-hydrolysing)
VCGIFGARRSWLAATHGDADAAAAAALAALRWRGRDGGGVVDCGDFVLGCARLAITERRSRQPLVRRGGRFAAVLNGAITDARGRWRQRSQRLGARAALPNDAWLPLLACQDAEASGLAALRGHHALAVVDAETGELWLARDAAGEKPLYVALRGGAPVAFASTVPALAALGVRVRLGPVAMARFFALGFAGAPESATPGIEVDAVMSGVHRAPGGAGRLACVAAPDAAAAAGHLAAELHAAVARCIDVGPDQPVGLSLSGGVDSSCLAAELAAVAAGGSGPLGERPRARRAVAYQFCAVGEDDAERQLAAAVAAHCGLPLRTVDGGPEVLDSLPALTALHGLPLGDPSLLAVHALARAAAADGVRVLLSGEGADEALLGYDRHRALRLLPRARWPLPWVPAWSMRRSARLLRAIAAADPYAELLAVTPPAFRERALRLDGTRASRPEPGTRAASAAERLRAAARVDAQQYLRWDLLPKLDVATMAAGIEGRCPYLDAGVRAAAAAEAPLRALGKAPLRAAYRGRLPAAVFAQRKRGFALPLDRWFRSALPWLDLLRDARTRQRDHVRGDALANAIDRHRRGAADLGRALYLVVAWELWLRSHEETAPCA